ncbi:protein LURP-one-related 11-like [Gastrolobium bilobum]|uniref:protein LURP-one-related 11-like n=1 Tax=Gastrolobium bilobum TaxID=150636 RepID=UPI002AB31A71|nr:protein LURP-one-related 11-like [Gastrolobium bilobum]
MGKVHPQALHSSTSCSFTSKQETFTLWMKSLVLNGKGCTVFDSDGQLVYRVDNYNCKCIDEVHLMDQKGNTLYTILRKQYSLSRFWEGYRSPGTRNQKRERGPSFRVYKTCRIARRISTYKVKLGADKSQPYSHKIESSTGKSACKISDQFGILVAELRRKKSSCGVDFGDDVLTMVVEPNTDLSLIMGLVVAYTLINCQM